MLKKAILFLLLLIGLIARSQEFKSKKELLDWLAKGDNDTAMVDIYNELCWPIYSYDVPDSSLYYGNKALELANKIYDRKRLSIAHRRLGITYSNIGDIKRSIHHQEESYNISKEINYTRGMYLALNNIGVAYLNNELSNKALHYFLKSLRYIENTDDYTNISRVYSNCGLIYRRIGDNAKAKSFFSKSNHFAVLAHDTDVIIASLCNLASASRGLNRMDSAKFYLGEAGRLLSDRSNSSAKFNYNMGWALQFDKQGHHKEALAAFLRTLSHSPMLADEITVLINIGNQYSYLEDWEKSLEYYKKAYDLSLKNLMYDNLAAITLNMSEVYEKLGKNIEFAKIMRQHVVFKDSNIKINTAQQIVRQQLEFDFERKQVADSIRYEQMEKLKNIELEAAEAKLNKEKTFRIMLLVMLVLIVIFAAFILNRFVLTRRQKKMIELQKHLVEVKNNEILDSINYAKRLQQAILPQLPVIKQTLSADILYLPKDIIGGDFYFFEIFNEHTFFAICDCTGHGIPGAIMSVVCHQGLQKAITEYGLTDPAAILEKTRQIVIENLNAAHQNIQDGMDCSLLVYNKKTGEWKWAGANNPVWIVHNNELAEVKADKQPVAHYEKSAAFISHKLDVKPGSFLYLMTDGYADQFGGPGGKKYKTKALKEFLSSISKLDAEHQVEKLQQNFFNWKGNLDQVDDVAIAVIKI